MLIRRLLLALCGAIAVSIVATGVAHADPPPPGPVGGPTHGTGPGGGAVQNSYFAPTTNLTTVANAVQIKAKSVTAVVSVPAGLAVTNPVEVSVLFGSRRVTQDYVRSSGLRFVFQLPEKGGTRHTENIVVNLTERTPTGAVPFHFTQPMSIEPLYDVTLSPLTFRLLGDCAVIGDVNPEVAWLDGSGAEYERLDVDTNETHQISRFAQRYVETGLAASPPKPGIVWTSFPFSPSGFHGPAAPRVDGPLLPDTTRKVHFTEDASNDGFCLAEFGYDQTITLRTYPQL